jgi:FtsP/CotA-like multicopper oxidase with cupredoxin domain
MSTNNFKLSASVALTLAAVLLAPTQAVAAVYFLKAEAYTMPDPNGGAAITMWGYSSCPDGSGVGCTLPSSPGPALTVPALDTVLTVNLLNTLTKPTSLVINGLIKPMVPVWDDGSTGSRTSATQRVRSFDTEAGATNGTAVYVWNSVKPGTYLYQSGTQPQVQVQMGLYGAVTSNAVDATVTTPAQAYAGITYDNQATLLYSEIDPALHAAVADDSYGTAPAMTSTFGYAPKYFLINGQPYSLSATNAVINPAGNPGTTLLRLLNAGLTTHVPMIQGTHWNLIAEDGKPYPFSPKQYTALLPAAKTMDVLLTADAGGATYAIMDRRLNLSNNGLSDGGMLAFLQFGAAGSGGPEGLVGNTAPVAGDDSFSSILGVRLSVAAPGVLSNDTDTVDNGPQPVRAIAANGTTACGGTYTLATNGSFVFTPIAVLPPVPLPLGCTATADTFKYFSTDGKAWSNEAIVTISQDVPSAPTLLVLDDFNRVVASNSLSAPPIVWNQTSGGTPAAPNIQADGTQAVAAATNLGGLAIWDDVKTSTQGASFDATPLADSALVLKATGGVLVSSPANYVRVRCEGGASGEVVVATMMGGSNMSIFVRQAGFAADCSGSGNLSAVVDAKGIVTAFLKGDFVGGVQLPDVAAWKGNGRIGIQLQTVGNTVDNFSGGSL